jgi:hypothetical protein
MTFLQSLLDALSTIHGASRLNLFKVVEKSRRWVDRSRESRYKHTHTHTHTHSLTHTHTHTHSQSDTHTLTHTQTHTHTGPLPTMRRSI